MTEAEFGTIQQEGVSRRDVMKRGALVGGAMVWATPIVQTMGSPAFASEGTPKDISYVALCYTCPDGTGGTTTCCVKFEFNDDGTLDECEEGNFNTPGCDFENVADDGCGDCTLFNLSSPDGGKTIEVCFKDTTETTGCEIREAHAIGKCGQDGCVSGDVSTLKRCATFTECS